MKIGCNWSLALADLIVNNKVNIDYIKTGLYGDNENQIERMRQFKPILLHGLGYFERSGMVDVGIVDFQKANKLLAYCDCPHYGLHLGITNDDIQSSMCDNDIHTHMSRQIQIFKKSLSVPLLLENVPDCPNDRRIFNHYPYVEPEKINKLLHDNDVGLLLDLTHAKITCQYRNWDIYDYLQSLSLDHIKEIHVNGSGYDEDGYPDDPHLAMSDEDYELLEWILGLAKPEIITLEYIGVKLESQETVIENLFYQLNKLNRICR